MTTITIVPALVHATTSSSTKTLLLSTLTPHGVHRRFKEGNETLRRAFRIADRQAILTIITLMSRQCLTSGRIASPTCPKPCSQNDANCETCFYVRLQPCFQIKGIIIQKGILNSCIKETWSDGKVQHSVLIIASHWRKNVRGKVRLVRIGTGKYRCLGFS